YTPNLYRSSVPTRRSSDLNRVVSTSPGRKVTILDVAREDGVSKSAVSLALRGDAGLGRGTRSTILATAQRLGYRPNRWARRLVQDRKSTRLNSSHVSMSYA